MNLLDSPTLLGDAKYNKKILLFDIENSPIVGYTWQIWETNVVEVKEEWYILCFAYKWLGEKETKVVALPDFRGYNKDRKNDLKLVQKLWDLFEQAEVIIAHNGDGFDIKKANSRFLIHGLEPPSSYQTVDTLKLARRYFKFDSNKLDALGQYLKLGRKVKHIGFPMWLGCMEGDMKSWHQMCEYNKQDVILLEKIYRKLRAWDKNPPNMNVILGGIYCCPTCGSDNVVKRGHRYTKSAIYQAYWCMNCGKHSQGEKVKMEKSIK